MSIVRPDPPRVPFFGDGGPAFPVQLERGTFAAGLTVRDYFAAQALGGLMRAEMVELPDKAAGLAYLWADAMLRERAK